MKQIAALLCLILTGFQLKGQTLYSKAFGEYKNPAIIFIHGGPGGNSNLFEGTTAENLAKQGFYVIVYDRRGEGRSVDENANMTYRESFDDLLGIYQLYKIEKAHLLGHSFGGMIATLFTEQYPEKVLSLTLAGALISQPKTYRNILSKAEIYFKNDSLKLSEIQSISLKDSNSANYRKACFQIAGEMNFYTMPKPTRTSTQIRANFETSFLFQTSYRNEISPLKFYQNESLRNIDNTDKIKAIIGKNIHVLAIYGQNDGIFSIDQLAEVQKIVGDQNFKLLKNCSHFLFVDQSKKFIQIITENYKLSKKGKSFHKKG